MESSVKWFNGHVCATSIYSLWTDPHHPGHLQALVYMLCWRGSNYTAEFCHVAVSGELLKRGARDESLVTPARVASAAQTAAVPGCWPLAPLGNAMLWKSVYGGITAALKRAVGSFAFYQPLVLGINTQTGLLVTLRPAASADGGGGGDVSPRAAIVNVSVEVDLDPAGIEASAASSTGSSLARARLCTLRDGYFLSKRDIALEVEIATKDVSFYRKYDSVQQPANKRRGDMADLFVVHERTLLLGEFKRMGVKVLLPRTFDCFVASSQAVSGLAAMALYKQWHATLFSVKRPETVVQIFAYLGPELNPCGEEADYCCFVGFPGLPTIKASSNTTEAVRDAMAAYRLSDGLWPALGMSAFHFLAPWEPEDRWPGESASKRVDGVAHRLQLSPEDGWGAGRVSCILESDAVMQGPWFAKFDFTAFFPTLYLLLFPTNERLAEVVRLRTRGHHPTLKLALVSFFGGLQHINPVAYRSIIALANGISKRLEHAVNQKGFAICTYVKDGFWGAAGNIPADSVSYTDALVYAEELRSAAQNAALVYVSEMGFSLPERVHLNLRLEGLFTDAISWSTHCYWLYNRFTKTEDFVGFPAKSGAGRAAKASLSGLLPLVAAVCDSSDLSTLHKSVRGACEQLVAVAFAERNNPQFWSTRTGIESSTLLPPAVYRNGSLLDKDCVQREIVLTLRHDCGSPSPVPWTLFPPPLVLGRIDCMVYLTAIFKTYLSMLNRAISASCDADESMNVEFSISDYAFLFT
ncbi:helicase-primase subunit [Equid alphaherpesvirus 8]|uniref:Helicase-primase subunit n=1 Tax=Equid alphaherpesvirus 8 TaxID=39637 RepID=A0A2K9QR02_9ALPH|nr:helicase-primase subunit [Equid alphaherpesvirus 8]AUS94707.1 helicase-primase subunit [Equid alphaherpesvirus 8]AUS94867.1 helicase-primase subunit [Equid alphaherpesvirus 8]